MPAEEAKTLGSQLHGGRAHACPSHASSHPGRPGHLPTLGGLLRPPGSVRWPSSATSGRKTKPQRRWPPSMRCTPEMVNGRRRRTARLRRPLQAGKHNGDGHRRCAARGRWLPPGANAGPPGFRGPMQAPLIASGRPQQAIWAIIFLNFFLLCQTARACVEQSIRIRLNLARRLGAAEPRLN